MKIHIGYDREEDKIELILASQGNVISTLDSLTSFLDLLTVLSSMGKNLAIF